MNEELPPWVAFVNDAVQRVAEKIDAWAADFATKGDLKLLQYQIDQERTARQSAVEGEAKARRELRDKLAADEADRRTKNRRTLGALWAVAGTLIIALSTIAVAFIHG